MTTWTEVSAESQEFETPADAENGYVVAGYVRNGYIREAGIWSGVGDTSTDWA